MGIRGTATVPPPPPLLFLLVVVLLPLARCVDVEPGGQVSAPGGLDPGTLATATATTTTTNQVGLPSAKSRQGARHANKFPTCPHTRVAPKLTEAEAAAAGDDSDRGDQRAADVKFLIAAVAGLYKVEPQLTQLESTWFPNPFT
jgi:hypothetical protein